MAAAGLIEVGYVARAHGVRGELRLVPHDPESVVLGEAPALHVGGAAYPVQRARAVPGGAWLVKLEGVDDRNRAEALRGAPVEVERAHLPLEEGEVLLADLVGCQVVLADGTDWGEVVAIDVGPQDRLVIHQDEIERLLPFVPELVVEVDLETGRIVVAPPADWPEARVGRRGGQR